MRAEPADDDRVHVGGVVVGDQVLVQVGGGLAVHAGQES